MCLAIPGKLTEISTDANGVRMGKANFGGIVKQICLEYTPEVEMGDYVLVHVGFALSKVDEEEAARTYKALEQMQQLGELDTPDVADVPDEDENVLPGHPERSEAQSRDPVDPPGSAVAVENVLETRRDSSTPLRSAALRSE